MSDRSPIIGSDLTVERLHDICDALAIYDNHDNQPTCEALFAALRDISSDPCPVCGKPRHDFDGTHAWGPGELHPTQRDISSDPVDTDGGRLDNRQRADGHRQADFGRGNPESSRPARDISSVTGRHNRRSPCCEEEARRYLVERGVDKRLDREAVNAFIRDELPGLLAIALGRWGRQVDRLYTDHERRAVAANAAAKIAELRNG